MKFSVCTAAAAALAITGSAALSHYGMIIPSDPMVSQQDGRSVSLAVSFSHPFERNGMVLEMPQTFDVTTGGETTSLLDQLSETDIMGQPGYTLDYPLERPGTYIFSMTPQPYWEPAEDAFITHYTKTYVSAFDDDEGWDTELGLKTEIVPLAKPFGLWEGNVFQGQVLLDGEAVPFAEVEVEFYNEDGEAEAPSELMITQTVKADEQGIFTYATPSSGWWGFAALNTAEEPMMYEDEEKAHELGAVIWVRFEEWDD